MPEPSVLEPIMSTSDWVLMICSVVLAATALGAPVLTEWLKRRFWAPRLVLDFDLKKPDCHTTQSNVGGVPNVSVPARPVHVYRLRVHNAGRSQARRCEVVIEGIAKRNAANELVWHDKSTQVSLVWGSGYTDFVDINTNRFYFCDFIFILHKDHQDFFKSYGGFNPWPNADLSRLGVEVRVSKHFHSQPNWLPEGSYRFKMAVFSDNAPVARREFDLAWSGTWAENEDGIFAECVVRSVA
jgi:hypothetical protein